MRTFQYISSLCQRFEAGEDPHDKESEVDAEDDSDGEFFGEIEVIDEADDDEDAGEGKADEVDGGNETGDGVKDVKGDVGEEDESEKSFWREEYVSEDENCVVEKSCSDEIGNDGGNREENHSRYH